MTPTKDHPGTHRAPAIDPADLYKLLLKSEKFIHWKPEQKRKPLDDLQTFQKEEKHGA